MKMKKSRTFHCALLTVSLSWVCHHFSSHVCHLSSQVCKAEQPIRSISLTNWFLWPFNMLNKLKHQFGKHPTDDNGHTEKTTKMSDAARRCSRSLRPLYFSCEGLLPSMVSQPPSPDDYTSLTWVLAGLGHWESPLSFLTVSNCKTMKAAMFAPLNKVTTPASGHCCICCGIELS